MSSPEPTHARPRNPLAWMAVGFVSVAALFGGGYLIVSLLTGGDDEPVGVTPPPDTTGPTGTVATTTTLLPTTTTATLTTTVAAPVPEAIQPESAVATAERSSVILRCDRELLDNPPRTFYGAEFLIDGDLNTGWGAGQDDGTGESVTLFLPGEFFVTSVGLTPGFAKVGPRFDAACESVPAFPHNGFVRRVRYTFEDGSTVIQDFEESPDLQRLDLEEAGGPFLTSTVQITLLEVVFPPGSDPDTILSEAEVRGFP